MKKNEGIITFNGQPMTLVGEMTRTGEKAQDFSVLDTSMKTVNLSDYKNKTRVISVVPSIDTGICSAQTRKFNEKATSYKNVEVLSISNDLPFALGRFCGAEGIDNVTTLSDYLHTDFGIKYGFLIEELRLLARGIIIIDKDDVIRYVEYVPEIASHPDYDKAFKKLEKIIE